VVGARQLIDANQPAATHGAQFSPSAARRPTAATQQGVVLGAPLTVSGVRQVLHLTSRWCSRRAALPERYAEPTAVEQLGAVEGARFYSSGAV